MATSEFGKAFRSARSAGKKTFTWNGKLYTTKMKGEGGKAKTKLPATGPTPAKRPDGRTANVAAKPTDRDVASRTTDKVVAAAAKPATVSRANANQNTVKKPADDGIQGKSDRTKTPLKIEKKKPNSRGPVNDALRTIGSLFYEKKKV